MMSKSTESHIARGNHKLLLIGVASIIMSGGMSGVFNRWFPGCATIASLLRNHQHRS